MSKPSFPAAVRHELNNTENKLNHLSLSAPAPPPPPPTCQPPAPSPISPPPPPPTLCPSTEVLLRQLLSSVTSLRKTRDREDNSIGTTVEQTRVTWREFGARRSRSAGGKCQAEGKLLIGFRAGSSPSLPLPLVPPLSTRAPPGGGGWGGGKLPWIVPPLLELREGTDRLCIEGLADDCCAK